MPENFSFTSVNSFEFFHFSAWQREGILHGFMGKTSPQKGSSFGEFCNAFAVEKVLFVKQVHGNAVADLRNQETLRSLIEAWPDCQFKGATLEADAIVFDRSGAEGKIALTLSTADCLPVIIRQGSRFALVHAGWRGLANGILAKSLKQLTGERIDLPCEVLIGPAAGAELYEVGPEVIEQIGDSAVTTRLENGKYLLSSVQTAKSQLNQAFSGPVDLRACEICTISDSRFFSYRQEGSGTGRNISFLIC